MLQADIITAKHSPFWWTRKLNLTAIMIDIKRLKDVPWKNQTLFVLVKSMNTPTGASTNPKNFDLNKNLNMNQI